MSEEFKEDRITIHLENNNALEKVRELVQNRLVSSGWRDEVRLACRKAITENGEHRIPTVDELIAVVTPKARSLVHDSVKKELLRELQVILMNVDKAAYKK